MKALTLLYFASVILVHSADINPKLIPESSARPNFIFIITDDQFKNMMNFLPEGKGQNLTPATDGLSSEATILKNMYVTSPVCTPSRYACLTGNYPSRSSYPPFLKATEENDNQTYVQWNTYITPKDTKTLPWRLKNNGYRTGIVGKNHVIEARGIKKPKWGDDPNDPKVIALLKRNASILEKACHSAGFDYAKNLYHNNPSHNGIKALLAHNQDWITDAGVNFIKEASQDQTPFFLWFATTLPHGPSDNARSWKADPRITPEGLLDEALNIQPERETLRDRVKAAGVKGWQKENLLWIDDGIAALIKQLKESQQLDNTIFIYFNDHGQRSKGTVYEGGVHSEAFIWRQAGFDAGNQIDTLISNVDFAPTILDFANIPYAKDAFDGVSFHDALNGVVREEQETLYFELGFVRGVRKGDWKYISLNYPDSVKNMSLEERQLELDEFNASQARRGKPIYNTDPMAPFSHIRTIPGGGDAEHPSLTQYPNYYDTHQLYNLSDDPKEQNNLAKDAEYSNVLSEMQLLLKEYLKSVPGSFGSLK